MQIDHTSYPTIVDLIATYAPLELRTTSHQWHARVNQKCPHWRVEQHPTGKFIVYVYISIQPTGSGSDEESPLVGAQDDPESSSTFNDADVCSNTSSPPRVIRALSFIDDNLPHATRYVRFLDVVAGRMTDGRWENAFPNLEVVRCFPCPFEGNQPPRHLFNAPIVVVHSSFRAQGFFYALPSTVQHLIMSVSHRNLSSTQWPYGSYQPMAPPFPFMNYYK